LAFDFEAGYGLEDASGHTRFTVEATLERKYLPRDVIDLLEAAL
jgi:hypothetical protein